MFIILNMTKFYFVTIKNVQYMNYKKVINKLGIDMKKFTILVAFDFSKSSFVILNKAVAFAKEIGGNLHVVHVVEDSFFSSKHTLESIKENGFVKLSREFETIKEENYHCVRGKIKVEVANSAKILNADLIILGNSGETHFLSDFIMGSHTKEIVKYSQTPVLVIKNSDEVKYDDILILTDLSDDSKRAIVKIADIFPSSNIKLINLFYLPIDNRINTYGFNEKDVLEYKTSIENEANEKLNTFIKELHLSASIKISAETRNSSLNPKLFSNEVSDINFDLLVLHVTQQQNVSFFTFDILEQSDRDVFLVK